MGTRARNGGKPCLWYSAERKRSISRVTKVRLLEKIMRFSFPPRMRPREKTGCAGKERRGKWLLSGGNEITNDGGEECGENLESCEVDLS